MELRSNFFVYLIF